jgi:hypothetical protein
LSANQGIRSFGLAAILGELTCITAALLLAPTLLQLFVRPRREPAPVLPLAPSVRSVVDRKPEPRDRESVAG